MVSFDAIISKLSKNKTECLKAEDYDIDLLKSEVHSDTEQFVNHLYCNLFAPSIFRPARFESSSSTLFLQDVYVFGETIADVSDHLPVFYMSQNVKGKDMPKCYSAGSR